VTLHPLERWREYGGKPDYAGRLSFGGAPYTQTQRSSKTPTSPSSARRRTTSSPTGPGCTSGHGRSAPQGALPDPEFAWQRERRIKSFFMHDVRTLGKRRG
jgi:hypothetical protein